MASTTDTRRFAGQNAARLLGRLAFQMNLTMKSPDPDAVHDLRVAIRRFSQTLGVFKSCFPGKESRKIRRRLKKLMLLAGAVRNCDIALNLLSKSRTAEAAKLLPKIQAQRKELARILTAALKRRIERKSSLKWRTALEAALANGTDAVGRIAALETARRLLPRMAKDFLERGHAAAQAKASAEKLHQFRITSKKFRYTLEMFAPLYGSALEPWLDSIKRTQALLGDLNDCATVAEMVVEFKGGGRVASWLEKRERRKVEEFRRRWPEEFANKDTLRGRIHSLSHPREVSVTPKKPVAQGQAPRKAFQQTA